MSTWRHALRRVFWQQAERIPWILNRRVERELGKWFIDQLREEP